MGSEPNHACPENEARKKFVENHRARFLLCVKRIDKIRFFFPKDPVRGYLVKKKKEKKKEVDNKMYKTCSTIKIIII